jgi:hypothetical protein
MLTARVNHRWTMHCGDLVKRKLGQSAATVAILMLMVCPAFADSPTTVINAVGNTGNTSGQAAVNNKGNLNQNTNQNSLGASSSTTTGVNVGGISITAPEGGVGASGTGEGYVGYSGSVNFASPAITFGNSKVTNVNLPGTPGILGAPGNFSQPYKPDVFINGAGPVRPAKMTYEQAKECRGGYGFKDSYVGANREKAKEITLVYAAWDKIDITNDISTYVGISSVEGADKPWLPAVCEAAYHAMEKGANYGVVEFIIRPKNTMKGFGFGSSGGGSVVPNAAAAASPYGLAASLGFGLGWSSQRVEGEVMIQVTGLKVPTVAAVVPPTSTPPPVAAPAKQPAATPAAPAPTAPQVPKAPEEGKIVVPNGKQPVKIPTAPQPQGDTAPPADPGRALNVPGQPQPSDPGQVLSVPGQPQPADPGRALSVPGQPQPSDPGQVLSVPGQPQPADPGQKLGVPGQPQPADPGQVLSVPGQPQQAQPQPQPAADTGPRPITSNAQPLSKLNPVGDARGPR